MSYKPGFETDRRTFIKTATLGLGGCLIGLPVLQACRTTEGGEALFEAFREPGAAARPFFRWWWNGNRITRDELLREMRIMYDVGVGGVEINPIGMNNAIENPSGREVVWLSDEWNERVVDVVEENERTGNITDLIVGTGWPFGGEFLADEETIQGLELEVVDLVGPGRHVRMIPGFGNDHVELLQAKIFPTEIAGLEEAVDVQDRVDSEGTLLIEIPEGSFQLYLLTRRSRFRDVFYGAAGGAGPVLDHFNRDAVEKYLNNMSDRLKPALGDVLGRRIRAMFCDSIELEGANWTSDFSDVFLERRGYDLSPYLPILLNPTVRTSGEIVDVIRRVRYDYSKTLAELFTERFIQTYIEWCHENGMLCRYQAYGHPWLYTDLLDGYLLPDIPEGDQWLFNRGWVRAAEIDAIRYAIWNKYASSGGHLTGRRVISSEAMTNTSGVFEASLAYIKQATDLNFVAGINHLVLHGFNYSPPEAGRPGWMRFGTYFHENNPWWPYARRWFDYASRLSQLFQDADPVAQVAILGPTPDLWSDFGLDRTPWNTTPWYLHALWQALNHHGYTSDYVNSTILQQADFEEGEIRFGPMHYRAIILSDVVSLEQETAEALLAYVKQGGIILFIGTIPGRSPGLTDHEENDTRVQQAVSQMLSEYSNRVFQKDGPEDGQLVKRVGEWMQQLGFAPDVDLSIADPRLFFVSYRKGKLDIFFFANTSKDRTLFFDAGFPVDGKTAWRWDPETGEKSVFQKGANLHITLSPLESLLLVFEPGDAGELLAQPIWDETLYREIPGPWIVELAGMDDITRSIELTDLSDLAETDGLASFSGTAVYSTSFDVSDTEDYLLDLGAIHETSEVTLNGKSLGARWYGLHRYDLSGKLQPGRNELNIKVTTLAYNYYRSLTQNKMARFWINRSRRDRPTVSGMLGPVRLIRSR